MSVRCCPKADKRAEVSLSPLCAKSGRTRRSKISYSITARSEVERIALKIGASAGRALSHRQRLRGQIVPAHIALLGMIDQLALVIEKMSSHVLWSGDSVRRQAFVTNRTV